MTAVRILVTGRVQGVGYRAWVKREALLRGLRGFVRNRADGAVEAVFAGEESIVRAMIAACRQGPFAAKVRTLTEEPIAHEEWRSFEVLPTM